MGVPGMNSICKALCYDPGMYKILLFLHAIIGFLLLSLSLSVLSKEWKVSLGQVLRNWNG